MTKLWLKAPIIAVLAGTLAITACGKKGDPTPPAAETEEES
ncbi:MAG: lipoprotein [Pseudomonadota bacterium]